MGDLASDIRQIVEQVLKNPDFATLLGGAAAPASAAPAAAAAPLGPGAFADVDSAVAAAGVAQRELVMLPLDTRRRMIEGMRRAVLAANASLSAEAVAETGLGNVATSR